MVISMNRDDMVSLRNSLGTITVRCVEGAVWVTVSGDRTDYILSSGKELTVSIKGKIVIMAEMSSSLRLFRPVTQGALLRMGLNTIPANQEMGAR